MFDRKTTSDKISATLSKLADDVDAAAGNDYHRYTSRLAPGDSIEPMDGTIRTDEGRAECSRIIAAAHAEAEEIVARAHANAEDERRAIYAEAAGSIADLSVSVASKIVEKTLDEDGEQRRLIERYIQEAGSLNVN